MEIDSVYSFNNLMRCVETPTHFVGELLGSKYFKSTERIAVKLLQTKIEKISSTNSYFIPCSDTISQPRINMNAIGNTLQSLLIITNQNYSTLKRLPFPIPTAKIERKDGDFPLNINDDVDLLILKDITLIKILDFNFYYRYIPLSIVVKKNVGEQEIEQRLEADYQIDMKLLTQNLPLNYISGVNFCHSNINTYIASQLISMANQIIRETSIDKFIEENKVIFANSLGYKNVLKITFKWIERAENEPFESKPDFILIKSDNTFDLLDLKTGAIKYKSLTKGKKLKNALKIRIRFIDYVNELISQLREYRNYFTYKKNILFIKQKYNLDVNYENMRLIGVVGNQNNFDTNQTNSALKPFKDYIKIISYFDLANMVLKSNPIVT